MKTLIVMCISLPLFILGCCDGCGDDDLPPPCDPIYTDTLNIQSDSLTIQLDGYEDSIIFISQKNELISYKPSISSRIEVSTWQCDTAQAMEHIYVTLSTSDLAPKISLSFDNQWNETLDSTILNHTVVIGGSYYSVLPNRNTETVHRDSISKFGRSFYNVYAIERVIEAPFETNGVLYSKDRGLLAFYKNDSTYYIRK